MSRVFACEKCGSKSFDHDDSKCRIEELESALAEAKAEIIHTIEEVDSMRIGNNALRVENEKLKDQNKEFGDVLGEYHNMKVEANSLRLLCEELVEALELSQDLPELNNGNYSDDEVCHLNSRVSEVCSIQKEAMTKAQSILSGEAKA